LEQIILHIRQCRGDAGDELTPRRAGLFGRGLIAPGHEYAVAGHIARADF
jgi:hypothetical protein